MFEFRSPSKNKVYIPSVLFLASWVLGKIFLLWGLDLAFMAGLKQDPLLAAIAPALVTGALLTAAGLLSLIILASYLLAKNIKKFFIAILLLFVASWATSHADLKLAPYMLKNTFANMGAAFDEANKDPISGARIRRFFGNTTPLKVCYGEKSSDGLYKCRICACPSVSELKLYDEQPRCYLYNRVGGGDSGVFMSAPCSSPEMSQDDGLIPSITTYQNTKSYAVYKYQDKKIQSCDEYRTWSDWDVNNAKFACEFDGFFACVIQDSSKCSLVGMTKICEKTPDKPNESYRRVFYTNNYSTSGFNYDEQCRSADAPLPNNTPINNYKSERAQGAIPVILSRGDIETLVYNIPLHMQQARMEPIFSGIKVTGFKPNKIALGSIYEKMKIKDGDIFLAIDSLQLTTPQAAAELFQKIRTFTEFNLTVERDGKLTVFFYSYSK